MTDDRQKARAAVWDRMEVYFCGEPEIAPRDNCNEGPADAALDRLIALVEAEAKHGGMEVNSRHQCAGMYGVCVSLQAAQKAVREASDG